MLESWGGGDILFNAVELGDAIFSLMLGGWNLENVYRPVCGQTILQISMV